MPLGKSWALGMSHFDCRCCKLAPRRRFVWLTDAHARTGSDVGGSDGGGSLKVLKSPRPPKVCLWRLRVCELGGERRWKWNCRGGSGVEWRGGCGGAPCNSFEQRFPPFLLSPSTASALTSIEGGAPFGTDCGDIDCTLTVKRRSVFPKRVVGDRL